MSIIESFRTALAEIRGHKLRSFLTLAGIILGTLALVVMTSLVDGVVAELDEGFADLGFDGVFYVVPRPPRTDYDASAFARSKGLRPEDVRIASAHAESLEAFAPVHEERATVSANGHARKVGVFGVTPDYAWVRNRAPAQGRFVSDSDLAGFGKVAILGYRLKQTLFGADAALGRKIEVEGISMTVVGVGRDMTHQFFDDDNLIEEMEGLIVPLTTLERYFLGAIPLSYVAVKARDGEGLEAPQREIDRVFALAHHGIRDFRVENIAEDVLRGRKEASEIALKWRMVLSSVAGISLLVGGIGLLSVMLIAIGERTFEIGLRKAIGASDVEIFIQFLIESVVLASVGAAVGIGIGSVINHFVGGFFKSGLPINFSGLLFTVMVDLLLGVGFGVYPALRAARLEPIESLHSV